MARVQNEHTSPVVDKMQKEIEKGQKFYSWSKRSVTASHANLIELRCRALSESEKHRRMVNTSDFKLHGVENIGYDNDAERDAETRFHGRDVCKDNDVEHDNVGNSTLDFARTDETTSVDGSGERKEYASSSSLKRFKGIVLALLSTVLVSVTALNTALLAGAVSSNEIVFIQSFTLLLFSLPLAAFEKASLRVSRNALILVLYRSVIGSVCSLLAYFAFQVMPIGNAKAIIYSSPIFTGLFSCLILHDACDAIDFILSIVALLGVVLVIQPPFIFRDDNDSWSSTSSLGAIFCLITAILLGTIYIALRKISAHRINSVIVVIVFAFVNMVISSLVTTAFWEWVVPRCGTDRQLLIMNGLFQFLSQLCLTLALKYEKPTTVALIRTADVLFTFLLDYIFFEIIPNLITITGATVIIGCLVVITLRKWRTEQRRLKKEMEEEFERSGDQNAHEDFPDE